MSERTVNRVEHRCTLREAVMLDAAVTYIARLLHFFNEQIVKEVELANWLLTSKCLSSHFIFFATLILLCSLSCLPFQTFISLTGGVAANSAANLPSLSPYFSLIYVF